MKIHIVFHSLYGHIHKLAEAIAEGAREVPGAEVQLFQVEETLSGDVLAKMGAQQAKEGFSDVPVATLDTLTEADAIIFGTPTRFGSATAQMRTFLDRTGGLWAKGALIGKVGSVFTSTGTQHGGQETTITSFHVTLLHHGMVVVGVPYSCQGLMESHEIAGGSPYGASTIAGADGTRQPTEVDLSIAKFQGKHVAEITKKIAAK